MQHEIKCSLCGHINTVAQTILTTADRGVCRDTDPCVLRMHLAEVQHTAPLNCGRQCVHCMAGTNIMTSHYRWYASSEHFKI
jgi:hypothetical protein